jgi:predicted Zn-dependent protease
LRALLLTTAVTLALAMPLAQAQEKLPDIGSSAGELLTPARQAEYGAMMLRELRNYGYLLDDPLVNDWLQTMGTRLGSNSDQPRQPYTFFVMKDRQINAFATLGGYIGVNAGLVLTAEREDEVAAVLSHEIAHVTQQHVLRGVERAQRDQIPILLGMLAAVVAAQASNSTSSGNATMAAISSGMGLMQQRQINYTRSNESEADRLGIRTLSRSGYDVDAMAGFFERMSAAMRGNEGGYSVPEFLRTHPVNITRISEAKARAEQMKKDTVLLTTSTPTGERKERVDPADPSLAEPLLRGNNPLLPSSVLRFRSASSTVAPAATSTGHASACACSARIPPRAGTRVCRPGQAAEGRSQRRAALWPGAGGHARRPRRPGQARQTLAGLLQTRPDNLWLALGLGEAESRAGGPGQQPLRAAAARAPQQPPGGPDLCRDPERTGQPRGRPARAGHAAPLLSQSGNDPVFQQRYARASELAGDSVRASEAYAEAAFLSGRPEQALMQLQALKRNPALDYVGRARVDARIEAITPPCWSCAARACRTRTWTAAERCMTGRWQSRPVPAR